MKRALFFVFLLFTPFSVFSLKPVPDKIIVQVDDDATYQIQVGAYKKIENANHIFSLLEKSGFTPNYEKYLDFMRVKIVDVKANQVIKNLEKLKNLNINDVIIRKGKNSNLLSEKWEILSPDAIYSSFEFNQDGNYIVLENDEYKTVHFGNYEMTAKNIYNLIDLGIVKVANNNGKDVLFSFATIDEPEKELNLTAAKSEVISSSQKTDMFSRTWKLVETTSTISEVGDILFISDVGTYFFTTGSGERKHREPSQWKWYDEENNLFEYSHDDGFSWYKIENSNLTKEFYTLTDAAGSFYRFVPARDQSRDQ